MGEPAAASALAPDASARPRAADQRSAWDQQPGENDLWFARFLRFVALGPGRSVSLVATGRRNAYPVPAHWPIQAKQRSWRERAKAFDDAARANPALISVFNAVLTSISTSAPNGEADALTKAVEAGGYQAPRDDEDYLDDEPRRSTSA